MSSVAPMRTDIPARLDRLPWSRFHLLMVIALGITWILDGLEVTIVGSIGPALQSAQTLALSSEQLGAAASAYVIGAVIGALVSGVITDRHGRRRVFYLTLCVYLVGVGLSASLVLMSAQAFLYNAVFFTYGLILTRFYHVPGGHIGLYMMTLAFGNLTGPLLLGPLFDTVGRRRMIGGTFLLSALLLLATAVLFGEGRLCAVTQTAAWMAIFSFASAAASSAYLTVSEIFPLEVRALAIALAYAAGTAVGGALSPLLFGALIGSGEPWHVAAGYMLAAVLLTAAGVTELAIGVDAEGRSLEAISAPLASAL